MAIEYTTWNPSDKSTDITLSNGNLTATSASNLSRGVRSILGISSGKYYWEIIPGVLDPPWAGIGIGNSSANLASRVGGDANGYGYVPDGTKRFSGSALAYGDAYVNGDIIGVALDMDTGKIWWAKNGVWQAGGDPVAGTNEAYSGISGIFYAMVSMDGSGHSFVANFGASALSYSVPDGFNSGFYSGSADVYYCVSGHVTENTTPVNRQIYLHNRSTGALINSTTSSGVGGYFYMETTYSGAHYVVCIDNAAGLDYNDLIYGNVYPTTTSG